MWRFGALVLVPVLMVGPGAAPAASARIAPQLTVVGDPGCDASTGRPFVGWRVFQNGNETGTFTSAVATPAGSTLTGFTGKIFPQQAGPESGGQTLPTGATSATLTVTVDFPSASGVVGTATVSVPACAVIHPTVSFVRLCGGSVQVTFSLPSSAPTLAIVSAVGHDGA